MMPLKNVFTSEIFPPFLLRQNGKTCGATCESLPSNIRALVKGSRRNSELIGLRWIRVPCTFFPWKKYPRSVFIPIVNSSAAERLNTAARHYVDWKEGPGLILGKRACVCASGSTDPHSNFTRGFPYWIGTIPFAKGHFLDWMGQSMFRLFCLWHC